MKYFYLILLLVSTLFAGPPDPSSWLVPILIHYQNNKTEMAWIQYTDSDILNRLPSQPLATRNTLFYNKFGTDTLWVSDSLYLMADDFPVLLYERFILLNKVNLVEVLYSDTLYPIGLFSNRFLRDKPAKIAKTKVPLEYDKIDSGIEDYFLYYHIYIYDHNWSVERVNNLLKKEGYESKEIKKAQAQGHIIVIEEVYP